MTSVDFPPRPKAGERLRVCHIITGTRAGGAQRMLYKLLAQPAASDFESHVVSLTGCDEVGKQIQTLGVEVTALDARSGRVPKPWRLGRLLATLRRFKPHVIQTWIYYADLVGGLASRWAGKAPVVWGIRHSTLDPGTDKLITRTAAKVCAALSSSLPARILFNSQAAQQVHAKFGYCPDKLEIIPNGFDLSEMSPSPAARRRMRAELSYSDRDKVVGVVGRFHPHKDHETFVKAAQLVARQDADVRFLLCGRGMTWENETLARLVRAAGVEARTKLIGPRDDVAEIYNSLEIAVSSSASESFANVIGEAMACELPCLVTDVGDSAEIVGNTGRVVPARSPHEMANSLRELLSLSRDELHTMGQRARQRVANSYEITRVFERYAEVWRQVASQQPRHTEQLRERRAA